MAYQSVSILLLVFSITNIASGLALADDGDYCKLPLDGKHPMECCEMPTALNKESFKECIEELGIKMDGNQVTKLSSSEREDKFKVNKPIIGNNLSTFNST